MELEFAKIVELPKYEVDTKNNTVRGIIDDVYIARCREANINKEYNSTIKRYQSEVVDFAYKEVKRIDKVGFGTLMGPYFVMNHPDLYFALEQSSKKMTEIKDSNMPKEIKTKQITDLIKDTKQDLNLQLKQLEQKKLLTS